MATTASLQQHRQRPRACTWMQAGVVKRKYCQRDFQCHECPFDHALRRAAAENEKRRTQGQVVSGKRGQIVYWKDKLRQLPAWERPCLHHLMGRIEFRPCSKDFQCANCEFDQFFDEQYTVHAVMQPVDVLHVQGIKMPHCYYLHAGHTWLKIEPDSTVRIGLDDFAHRLLGPFDRVEAPLIGKKVQQNCSDTMIYRGHHTAKVPSPVSGVVTAINPALREKADVGQRNPYTHGWVMRVHAPNLRQELKALMIGAEAETFISADVDGLMQIIEGQVGPLAADGGELGTDIFGHLPQLGWRRLTRRFLRT